MAPGELSFPAEAFSNEAASALLRARHEGRLCDFELVCQGKRFPVHKLILCLQSPVFEMACFGQFREPVSNSYEILDADSETVECMVQYIYTGGYDTPFDLLPILNDAGFPPKEDEPISNNGAELSERNRNILLTHAKVVALADKYIMEKLAAAALNRFYIGVLWGRDKMEFLRVVPFVYTLECASSKKLRQTCIEAARACFGPGMAVRGTNRRRIDDATARTPNFATDLLQASFTMDADIPTMQEAPASSSSGAFPPPRGVSHVDLAGDRMERVRQETARRDNARALKLQHEQWRSGQSSNR